MATKPSNQIEFIVEYEDGKTAYMWIDKWTLARGDHVALIIARENQQPGSLPWGKIPGGEIKSVKRAPISPEIRP